MRTGRPAAKIELSSEIAGILEGYTQRRSASWLNQVERWFALLADKQIERGVHRSVNQLKANIAAFIQAHNDHPKPFIWTRTADAILETIARYCSQTLAIHAAIS
jgi:hypothetical protein